MGKRIGILGALTIVLTITIVSGSGFWARSSLIRYESSLGAPKTQAQEITLSPRVTLSPSHAIINNDAIRQQMVIVAPLSESGRTKQMIVWATGYTSDPAETDDTPFITASGSMVRDGVAAANFLPIGTQFMLPEQFGDKVFTVEDRMNARYNNQHIVDIWFEEKTHAKTFGKRMLTLEIL